MILKRTAMIAALAASCGMGAMAADSATMSSMNTSSTTAQNHLVSIGDARDAALQRIGNNATLVRASLDQRGTDSGSYKMVVVDSNNRYDVTVNARTGMITNVDSKPIISERAVKAVETRGATTSSGAMSPQRAKQVAMERVRGGTVTAIDSDYQNNRLVYNIEMMSNNAKVDMRMDAGSGEIIAYDETSMNRQPNAFMIERTVFQRGPSTSTSNTNTNTSNDFTNQYHNTNSQTSGAARR